MKKRIKIWAGRLAITVAFIVLLLITLILKPAFSYACKTVVGNYTIYHNKPLDETFKWRLYKAKRLIKSSSYYNAGLKLDICLNDGPGYSKIITTLGGAAFARGFYNKVVLLSNINPHINYAEINGYTWNLTQLLAHEMVHCLQFQKLGLLHSNPIAAIPGWKWEGYAEYIARKDIARVLTKSIEHFIFTKQQPNNGWIKFEDGTGTVMEYYKSWLLIQFCMDYKKMGYDEILNDTTSENMIAMQMMSWYEKQ